MKRAGNIYPRIAEEENLRLAFFKASKGKQGRREVIAFRGHLDRNLRELGREILDRELTLGDYRFFEVRDPKKRLICAASFRERVLHHAIMNLCEPALESYSIHDSYACRKGKGSLKALLRCQHFSRNYGWFLKLDIRKYFDSIDQGILLHLLHRRFKDADLIGLFRLILDSYSTAPGKGVPIGNLISQHLANFYLGAFDHWVKEVRRISGYVRYMDDCILWHPDKRGLKEELAFVTEWLRETLRLKIKDNVQLNRSTRGIPFLGYRVGPGWIRLSAPSKGRFVGKFRAYERRMADGIWSEGTLARHVEPLVAFTKVADAAGLRREVIARYGVSS